MPVSSSVSRIQYVGDGSQVEFPIPFYFISDSHLRVVLYDSATDTEEDLVLTTDYTVDGVLEQNGGTLTMLVAPAATEILTILRDVPITQLIDWRENELFNGGKTELAFDKLTMILQQLYEIFSRGILLKVTHSGDDPDFPAGGLTTVFPASITALVDADAGTFTFAEQEPLAAGGWQTKSGGITGTAVELIGGDTSWRASLPVDVLVYVHEDADAVLTYLFETPKPCNC
jgi:hypothetical protein